MSVGLMLGDLDLMDPTGSPFAVEALAAGTDLGNPKPIMVAIRSLLQDGSVVVHEGDDVRDVVIQVIITAPDSAALADGDAALMAELYRRNTLTYTAVDGWGTPTVFDVVTSTLENSYDDLAEVNGERIWLIRLTCLPFGRPAEKTSFTSLPATGTTTTSLDDGSATTGWTGSHTVTSSGGRVRSTSGVTTARTDLWLTKTFGAAQDLSVQQYVQVDWSLPYLLLGTSLTCHVDGVEQEKVADVVLPSGLVRSTFLSSDASATTFKFAVAARPPVGGAGLALELSIDQLSKTDLMPQIGTGRQLMRSVDIKGTRRTQPDLAVSHASTALGELLLYTSPKPFTTPSLRPFRTSAGATTTDAAMVSGVYEDDISATPFAAELPKQAAPDGTYVLFAKLKASASATVTVTRTVGTRLATYPLRGEDVADVSLALTTSWGIRQVGGRFRLPSDGMAADADATVYVELEASAAVQLDEAWLFNVSDGELTHVNLAAAFSTSPAYPAATRFWMLPPDVDTAYTRIFRGTEADMSDAFAVTPSALGGKAENGAHTFQPGANTIFTVATGAADAVLAGTYYSRHHTHVAGSA